MIIDYSVLYVILIVVATIGVIFGTLYLKKKGLVSQDDLIFVSNMLNISMEIIDELNISKETEIKKIGSIVFTGLNLEIGVFGLKGDRKQIIKSATDTCFKLCEQQGIKLTDNRKNLISQLLELGLNEKLMDAMESK